MVRWVKRLLWPTAVWVLREGRWRPLRWLVFAGVERAIPGNDIPDLPLNHRAQGEVQPVKPTAEKPRETGLLRGGLAAFDPP